MHESHRVKGMGVAANGDKGTTGCWEPAEAERKLSTGMIIPTSTCEPPKTRSKQGKAFSGLLQTQGLGTLTVKFNRTSVNSTASVEVYRRWNDPYRDAL